MAATDRVKNENDVDRDETQALTRVTGDRANDTNVGRRTGQDEGYTEQTGAERRENQD